LLSCWLAIHRSRPTSAATVLPLACAPFITVSRPLMSDSVPPLSSVVSDQVVPLPFS